MKIKELQPIKSEIVSLAGLVHPRNNIFSSAVMTTIHRIDKELKEHSVPRPKGEEIDNYNNAVADLITKHSFKDKNDKVILSGGQPRIKNQEEFEKELEELKKDHPVAMAKVEAYDQEVEDVMNQTASVIFHKVKESEFPPMNAMQLEIAIKYLCE